MKKAQLNANRLFTKKEWPCIESSRTQEKGLKKLIESNRLPRVAKVNTLTTQNHQHILSSPEIKCGIQLPMRAQNNWKFFSFKSKTKKPDK